MGFLEWIESDMGWGKWVAFVVLSLTFLFMGGVWEYYIPVDIGLTTICFCNAWIVSTLVFIFFMCYTGNWTLILGMAFLLVCFGYLLSKPYARDQLMI
jgi:hypothetical protein